MFLVPHLMTMRFASFGKSTAKEGTEVNLRRRIERRELWKRATARRPAQLILFPPAADGLLNGFEFREIKPTQTHPIALWLRRPLG